MHHYDVTERTLVTASLTVTDGARPREHQDDRVHRLARRQLQCESAPGTGQFASCDLELLEPTPTVTVTLDDRSCDAHGNAFRITAPIAETLFTDGCYSPAWAPPST